MASDQPAAVRGTTVVVGDLQVSGNAERQPWSVGQPWSVVYASMDESENIQCSVSVKYRRCLNL